MVKHIPRFSKNEGRITTHQANSRAEADFMAHVLKIAFQKAFYCFEQSLYKTNWINKKKSKPLSLIMFRHLRQSSSSLKQRATSPLTHGHQTTFLKASASLLDRYSIHLFSEVSDRRFKLSADETTQSTKAHALDLRTNLIEFNHCCLLYALIEIQLS